MKYKDYTFDIGEFRKANEIYDSEAIVNTIKAILLTKPGNFPFSPNFGMNIFKYKFDFFDDITINEIREELTKQILLYIPNMTNISVNIEPVENDYGKNILGINIKSEVLNNVSTMNFILVRENDDIQIIDEVL